MTRMITRRWWLGSVMVFAGAAFPAAQPVGGVQTVRWQIEAGG
jgi:hypothetical protein